MSNYANYCSLCGNSKTNGVCPFCRNRIAEKRAVNRVRTSSKSGVIAPAPYLQRLAHGK